MSQGSSGVRNGPVIQVPGQQLHQVLIGKEEYDKLKKGYDAKHLFHALAVDKMSKAAYKGIDELVSTECRLVHIPSGKTARIVIGVSYHILSALESLTLSMSNRILLRDSTICHSTSVQVILRTLPLRQSSHAGTVIQ
jgi:hypothetical protein